MTPAQAAPCSSHNLSPACLGPRVALTPSRRPLRPRYIESPLFLARLSFLVHPVNGEVPPVKGRPWKLPHYANRGKTSSSRGELASARSCFSTVRTALGKLRITGLLARFDVARSFPQFPRPLLLQPTIWTSERGADLGSGRCQPRPHLPIYRMTLFFLLVVVLVGHVTEVVIHKLLDGIGVIGMNKTVVLLR